MHLPLTLNTLLIATLGILLVRLFRNLLVPRQQLPVSADWIHQLSADRYRPMGRLLGNADYEFLAAHPGYGEARARCIRRERRKTFRGCLNSLKADFDRVYTALQVIMVQSTCDRPDLGLVLLRQKAIFRWGILRVEFRLALHACGWAGTVEVGDLAGVLEALGGELRSILPAVRQPLQSMA